MKANYRQIPNLLAARQPFEGNSMSAQVLTGPQRDGDRIAHMGRLYGSDYAHDLFAGRMFDYIVLSYGTPIAGVTVDGEVVINHTKYSVTTSRHQGMLYALERD